MDWLFDLLVKIIEGLLVAVVIALLAILLPAKTKNDEIDFQEFIENPKKASKAGWIFFLYIFLIVPVVAYPFGLLLEKLNNITERYFSDSLIVVYPSFWAFYIVILFTLYAFSCKPSKWFLETILRSHYNYYRQNIAFSEYSTKIDHKKLANGGFIIFLFLALFLLFLQLKSHTYFYSDRVEFFDFPTWKNVTYTYKDVSKIIHTPGFFKETGGVDNNEHYRIYFNDNNHWSSLTWNDLNEDTINAIKLVSEKTKKIIEEIPGIKN